MDNKITVIEGPTPTFELAHETWPFGLVEGSNRSQIARTTLRTFNGKALIERCQQAWHERVPMSLEFRSEDGMKAEAPIVAARAFKEAEGDVLWVWVRFDAEKIDLAMAYEDESDEDDEDWDMLDSPS